MSCMLLVAAVVVHSTHLWSFTFVLVIWFLEYETRCTLILYNWQFSGLWRRQRWRWIKSERERWQQKQSMFRAVSCYQQFITQIIISLLGTWGTQSTTLCRRSLRLSNMRQYWVWSKKSTATCSQPPFTVTAPHRSEPVHAGLLVLTSAIVFMGVFVSRCMICTRSFYGNISGKAYL